MNSKWKVYKLSDVADIFDSLHKTPEYVPKGISMVRVTDIKEGYLNLSSTLKVSSSVYEEFTKKYSPSIGDIVISRVGTYGNFSYVAQRQHFCLGQNTAIIHPRIENKFLYYSLLAPSTKQFLESVVTGSTQKTVSLKNIKAIPIPLPSERIQKYIANILSTLDDKIELNQRINWNLERQAQAIYTSMFIADAKTNWKLGHFCDLVTVRYGKGHKKLADGSHPVFGSGGVMRYVERPLYDQESVLIPRKGTLNNVMYVNEPFWSVDTMFYTEMRFPNIAKFVYHFVKSKDLASMNAGSAVPSMTTDILNAMELAIPDTNTLAKFESLVAPMYLMMEEHNKQSRKLSTIRDTLLPKLMAGEIEVRRPILD